MAISIQYQPSLALDGRSPISIPLPLQLLCGALVVLAFIIKIWVRMEITDIGYELASERQQMVDLDRRHRELTFRYTQLTRHDTLRDAAWERLGMDVTPQERLWKLKEGA